MQMALDVVNLLVGSVMAAQANEDYNKGHWRDCIISLAIGTLNMLAYVL
jgi:hypothetical protein